jgi:glycosyltransferase involved in cell wall biosynthesis
MTDSFVCAFRGRRDSYQVPLALAEEQILDQFITDAYALPWLKSLLGWAPQRIREKADFRSMEGIPPERVRSLWGTTLVERARHRLGYAQSLTFMKLDRRFSTAAAQRARTQKSDLLLYSPYAWEAFVASYRHTPRRVLFQYHPHPEMEQRILASDGAKHPRVGESFSGTRTRPVPEHLARRERDSWKHADLVLCASSFTRRSLLEAGADESCCQIVPYGIEVPQVVDGQPPRDTFQAVFVGSGGQRKGLHHLLIAWDRAKLPAESKLKLVCRAVDTEIEKMAHDVSGVELIRGVAQSRLSTLYAESTLFVMPSLVEGFGQVYLEALAQGCPVLGTENTCLPDLGDEAEGIFLTEPGDIEQLTTRLESLAELLPGQPAIRTAARERAAQFTWPAFRDGIRGALLGTLNVAVNVR